MSREGTSGPTALVLWHGAHRWEGPPTIQPGAKKATVEHGPGLYLTTSAQTARKYAKGGGVVMRFELDPELRWLEDVKIPLPAVQAWVRTRAGLRKRAEILADIQRHVDRVNQGRDARHLAHVDDIPAFVLVNLLIAHEALTGAHAPAMAEFLVNQGVDASLVEQNGGTESWIVLFNLEKIRSLRRARPDEVDDLPTVPQQLASIRKQNPRPIPLDDARIAGIADNLVMELHKLFVRIADREPAGLPFGQAPPGTMLKLPAKVTKNFGFVAPVGPNKGKVVRPCIAVTMGMSPAYSLVLGASAGSIRLRGEDVERPAVTLVLNGRYTAAQLAEYSKPIPSASMPRGAAYLHLPEPAGIMTTIGTRLFAEIWSPLRHELTHILDPAIRLGDKRGGRQPRYATHTTEGGYTIATDKRAYYNDPAEVAAHQREVIDDVTAFVRQTADVTRPRELLDRALTFSSTWRKIEPHLDTKNKKRILSAAYRAVEEARPAALERLRQLRAEREAEAERARQELEREERQENPRLGLPDGTRLVASFGRRVAYFWIEKGDATQTLSHMEMKQQPFGAWQVAAIEAPPKLLPLLFALALEYATENGDGLVDVVAPDAPPAWAKLIGALAGSKTSRQPTRWKEDGGARPSERAAFLRPPKLLLELDAAPGRFVDRSGRPALWRGGDHELATEARARYAKYPAFLDQIADILHRARRAGAKGPLTLAGVGSTGAVLCDAKGQGYKVGRAADPGTRMLLRDEAAWLEDAKTVPWVRDHVVALDHYDAENVVIVRSCVDGKPGTWGDVDRLYELHQELKKQMAKLDWGAPEFKEDSWVQTDDGAWRLVDAGFVLRMGRRYLRYVSDSLDGVYDIVEPAKDLLWGLDAEIRAKRITAKEAATVRARLAALA
jgi:hypothetical protein